MTNATKAELETKLDDNRKYIDDLERQLAASQNRLSEVGAREVHDPTALAIDGCIKAIESAGDRIGAQTPPPSGVGSRFEWTYVDGHRWQQTVNVNEVVAFLTARYRLDEPDPNENPF